MAKIDLLVPVRLPNTITRKVGDSLFIIFSDNFDDKKEKLHVLNNTGAFVWGTIDNKRPVSNIIKLVLDKFIGKKEVIEKDIKGVLNTLFKHKLIKFRKNGVANEKKKK